MNAESMPKLSETLEGPKHPEQCQGCGRTWELSAWQEYDERDRPTPVMVVLCLWCGNSIVEPHPRLYRELPRFEPRPGTMALCGDCRHREGTACRSPLGKAEGGPGLAVDYPRPDVAHVDYRGKRGRRAAETIVRYRGPATACSGREVRAEDPALLR